MTLVTPAHKAASLGNSGESLAAPPPRSGEEAWPGPCGTHPLHWEPGLRLDASGAVRGAAARARWGRDSCGTPGPARFRGKGAALPGGAAMLRALRRRWASYRYRFVPWIALHLRHKRRTIRYVPEKSKDKIISDEDVLETLLKIFKALFINNFSRQMDFLALLPEIKSEYLKLLTIQYKRSKTTGYNHQSQNIFNPEEVLFNTLGFSITRDRSSLISAGTGVFVTKGFVPKGAVVSMYPGTVYQKYEPIFFQSIGNPFIFRCIDGVLIDGNDKGISKAVYRSCSKRDQLGPFQMSDITWLTPAVQNPLAVGQYVNNCSHNKAANVCYQEFDVPEYFPIELKQYLPNITYSHDMLIPLRCVVLVALREIKQGEELFSNYYTIVN
ncbi:SET domain-containing protein 9 isoform X2 [Terrapene carolina triunguis]|uniref:SET domain containing 9 n=1 Tax=Terrapene triunguis TaxID=2587831 RepID=A0A674JK86_9SAUR|nr:SET domain-containing protein 9 isoform X2 [Terrapene carolina triunguis]